MAKIGILVPDLMLYLRIRLGTITCFTSPAGGEQGFVLAANQLRGLGPLYYHPPKWFLAFASSREVWVPVGQGMAKVHFRPFLPLLAQTAGNWRHKQDLRCRGTELQKPLKLKMYLPPPYFQVGEKGGALVTSFPPPENDGKRVKLDRGRPMSTHGVVQMLFIM